MGKLERRYGPGRPPARIRVSGVEGALLREARDAARAFWETAMPPGSLGRTADRSREPRLGWVDLPLEAEEWVLEGRALRAELREDGIDRVVVVGMGGSGLGAATLVSVLPPQPAASFDPPLQVEVLNSLAPEAVRAVIAPEQAPRTAYFIASKSGETVETAALEAVVCEAVEREGGSLSRRLIALSDPGSPLLERARDGGWRALYAGQSDVGGRFSALGPYGLLPAELAARDAEGGLASAARLRRTLAREFEGVEPPEAEDPGVGLGVLLAVLHAAGRRSAHLSASPEWEAALPWLEQLFAESAGKEGRGLLPVVLPPHPRPAPSAEEAAVLIHLGETEDEADRRRLDEAAAAGVPVIRCPAPPADALGEMFRWQVAVAGFAHGIGVDPYDQPDIDGSKALARRLLAGEAVVPAAPRTAPDLGGFLRRAAQGGLAVNAFGHRSAEAEAGLADLQRRLAEALGAVPAVAFGPALLHTLGQLEKGGPPDLAVLMLTWGGEPDEAIPARGGDLFRAPRRDSPDDPFEDELAPPPRRGCGEVSRLLAAADYGALREAGREVCWLDAGAGALAPLLRAVEDAAAALQAAGGDG